MQIRSFVRMAQPDRLIEDGDALGLAGWDLRAVWTPGHSPGHLCFHSADRRLVLSGDHVLPRISPNISYHSQQIHNPLADYLDSLVKVERLDCDEVLPGPRVAVRGAHRARTGAPRTPPRPARRDPDRAPRRG